jgi:hypothetical protein
MPAVSGLSIVATAGVATPLGDQIINAPLTVKAMQTNTGLIYLGHDGAGSVADDSGFQLSAGDQITFRFIGNLASVLLDASVDGEGVTWLILNA